MDDNLNLKNNIMKKDLLYFTKIFNFLESAIPVELGKWKFNLYVCTSKKISKPSESIVTFQEIPSPTEVKDIPFFHNFNYLKATIEYKKNLPNTTNEDTIHFNCELTEPVAESIIDEYSNKKEVILVRASEVVIRFMEKYNLGLYSLKYFCSATPLTSGNYVAKFAREIIQDQVQINFEYDNVRLSFHNNGKEDQYYEKYLLFDHVIAMYAFAQIQLERKFTLPNNEACIIFKDNSFYLEEKSLELMFFDHGFPLENKKLPLSIHPEYPNKIKEGLLSIKRKNVDLADKIERLKAKYVGSKNIIKGLRYISKDLYIPLVEKFMRKTANEPPGEVSVIAKDIQNSYISLTNLAARDKEVVLNKIEKRKELKTSILTLEKDNEEVFQKFIRFVGNIEGLPAHFAAIPIGYCKQQTPMTDEELGQIVKFERKSLIYNGDPYKEHEQLIIELNTDRFIDENQNEIIEYVNLIFGEKPCPWYFLQGLIALFKIYDNHNGFKSLNKLVKVTFEEFIDIIRPNRTKRARAFGHERNPVQIFRAVCELQERLYYKRTHIKKASLNKPGNHSDRIRGFFKLYRDRKDDKHEFYKMAFNSELLNLIDFDRKSNPLFVLVNTQAMFSYKGQSLDYMPAAQLSLELYAKENLYRKNRCTIFAGTNEFPNGITRKAYMHRFGFLRGRTEDDRDLLKRLDRTWGTFKDVGIISDVRIDGKENKKNKLDTKLYVDMHNDYVINMNITEKKQQLKKLNSILEAPLDINNLIKKHKIDLKY